MPFTRYGPIFDPEALIALQTAFDLAWSEVATHPIVSTDEQSARELIAMRIVAAARENGEHDPERLKQHALKAFERPSWAAQSTRSGEGRRGDQGDGRAGPLQA